jgi:hypothetical protein
MLSEKVMDILRKLAIGPLGYTDLDVFCLYCDPEHPVGVTSLDYPHEENCIISLARELLRREGYVLNVYSAHCETHILGNTDRGWATLVFTTLAFREQDVIDECHIRGSRVRNIEVKFIRRFFKGQGQEHGESIQRKTDISGIHD